MAMEMRRTAMVRDFAGLGEEGGGGNVSKLWTREDWRGKDYGGFGNGRTKVYGYLFWPWCWGRVVGGLGGETGVRFFG
jgi:hypothetical protein